MKKSLCLLFAASLLGCNLPGSGDTTREAQLDNETDVNGSPGSCPVIPSTITPLKDSLKITLPQNACAKLKVCMDSPAWESLPETTYVPGIDVVILFDVTGSMSPYINALIKNIQSLIQNLHTMTPNLRLGLASYRDFADRGGSRGDLPFILNVPLTLDVQKVADGLKTLRATGGGDLPESLATAIRATIDGKPLSPYFGASDMNWDKDPSRVRIVLGVSDASNRRDKLPTGAALMSEVGNLMKEKGILFLGIGRKASWGSTSTEAHGSCETSSTSAGGSKSLSRLLEGKSSSMGSSSRYKVVISGSKALSFKDADDDDDDFSDHSPCTGTPASDPSDKIDTVGPVDMTSYSDLAYLAGRTGAIVQAPGIDLDGDGKTTTYGEIAAGQPAVLLMDNYGNLQGASKSADPTRVLADAITMMIRQVKPFQYSLKVNSNGRNFTPESNTLAISPMTKAQQCFSEVAFEPLHLIDGCPGQSEITVAASEELTSTLAEGSNLKAKLEVDLNCGGPITTPSVTPTATATPSATPSPTPTPTVTATPSVTPSPTATATPSPTISPSPTASPSPTPSPTPTCTGFGCNGGVLGV